MPAVTVPAEFFRGELRVYGDWREAFARELLQNAVDANPTRIDVEFQDIPDGGRIVFTDNGHGMTRDVLENVFFALGRTTKTGPDSVGGFGRARIIICFAQRRYTLRTGHLLVTGQGGDYEITEVPEWQPGCRFEIDTIDEDVKRLRWAFEALLRQSALSVPVHFDGRQQHQGKMASRATRVLRDGDDNPWAKVYVDANGVGRLIVRVHGLPMFDQYLYGQSDDVVVELLPARSREVLSASRDTLHTVYKDALDLFVSDLATNRRAALGQQDKPLDLRVEGGGFLATDSAVATETVDDFAVRGTSESTGEALTVSVTPANDAARANFAALAPVVAERAARQAEEVALWGEPQRPALPFDVYLYADNTDTRVKRLLRKWSPRTWVDGKGRRQRALLFAWKAAVNVALDALVAQRPDLGRVLWTVGFTFDDQAVHKGVGDGHVFAINPCDTNGKMRFQLTQRASRQALLAIATHEVCHVIDGGHDEQFAARLTGLFGALDVNAADKAMREAAAAA